uniref:Uncharacterized protein n=1 Tax=Rhizophora mucronata TaxID=61149 RepID=A0A2P2P8A7_RHIMU
MSPITFNKTHSQLIFVVRCTVIFPLSHSMRHLVH